jgi:hypothetical protein
VYSDPNIQYCTTARQFWCSNINEVVLGLAMTLAVKQAGTEEPEIKQRVSEKVWDGSFVSAQRNDYVGSS